MKRTKEGIDFAIGWLLICSAIGLGILLVSAGVGAGIFVFQVLSSLAS
ncbi:unnamed protein product [marine sediment metagenome]|uniref:Uncharacterized protein n=1 Tax=marine sediment metagenome TaxID=412755 RepID=X0Z9Y2_9ZZZZ